MTKKEFEVLRYLSENIRYLSQREVAEATNLSIGTINKIISSLKQNEYINKEYLITEKGLQALEPYKVKSAIILAAGMSTRFIPVSYEIPKGLIRVKGDVLIERIIEQLQKVGINEIVVVVGYMMEKFLYLRNKYNVKLVVNNEFATKNTHSSVYVSRDYLSNTYICCSDNYYPKNMFHKYEYRAFYCSTYLEGVSYVERAFQFDKNGLIYDTNKPSNNQWIMYGHAYFDQEFTDKFKPILESYFGRLGIEYMYWETIYAENVKSLPMWIQKCEPFDILEFDSMDELKQFDPGYIYNNKVRIFDNICRVLNCELTDIEEIQTIKKGLNNQSFKFKCNGNTYIYRHPGLNATGVVDRKKEAVSLKVAKELGVDDTFIHIDAEEGWKISRYVETTDIFDFKNKDHVAMLSDKLKKLHSSKISVGFGFDYKEEANKIIDKQKYLDAFAYRKSKSERKLMQRIFDFLDDDMWQVSLCHNDLYEPNLLVNNDELYIIDWEFAGDSDIGYDICKLFTGSTPSMNELDIWLQDYFGRETTCKEKLHLVACASVIYYYWYIWGIYASKNNQDVSGYMIEWYDKMIYYRELANKLLDQQ